MKLTKKEIIVMELLLQGLSRKEIAKQMDVTVKTSSTHIRHIYKKLNVHCVGELAQSHIKKLEEKIKQLEKQVKHLTPYKQRWEYLRARAFAERMGDI